jgi:hypothetical protein
MFSDGVKEYQTLGEGKLQTLGSPGSLVASVLSVVVLNGSDVITCALAKLSLVGGAAWAGVNPLKERIRAKNRTAKQRKNLWDILHLLYGMYC